MSETESFETINATLSELFGFRSFRPHQEEIVRAILRGRDVFAVMPTGGGKSLCYQLPARVRRGVCVVISPLISLMKDQVDAALANGLQAATLNSTTPQEQRSAIGRALRAEELDLLYISPERFNSDHFIERLKTLEIAFFAVDEAHCISEWGHDFRPDYLALARIVKEFPGIPIAAFTATATPRVSEDILARLNLHEPYLVRASFNRPNLFYRVVPKRNLDEQLVEFARENRDRPGIIYRTSRKKVEATVELLCRAGHAARAYHAGMPDPERHAAQEAFRRDECTIIVATVAFGMGIDKPNVRYVVHADLPKNIEGYYQETGRAGRDGEPAGCTLFFGRQDIMILSHFVNEVEDEQARRVARTQLDRMIRFAEQDGCRRAALLNYFGETLSGDNCGGCDVCRDDVEREDATVPAQKILSAVVRTGQRFGAIHICDVVTGADTEKIRSFGHDKLPTFGVGRDRPKFYWRTVVEALLARKVLEIEDPARPILKLTPSAREILRGESSFLMIRREEVRPKKDMVASRLAEAELTPLGRRVVSCLKELRREIAFSENIPPYVVFSDRTVRELALYLPEREEELLAINGIGLKKSQMYGERIIGALRSLIESDPAEAERSRLPLPEIPEPKPKSTSLSNPSHLESLRMVREGNTIEQAAALRSLTPGTIITHLERAAQEGHRIDVRRFFEPDRLDRIARWFEAAGNTDDRLKPVVEASGGELGYDEARLARLVFLEDKH